MCRRAAPVTTLRWTLRGFCAVNTAGAAADECDNNACGLISCSTGPRRHIDGILRAVPGNTARCRDRRRPSHTAYDTDDDVLSAPPPDRSLRPGDSRRGCDQMYYTPWNAGDNGYSSSSSSLTLSVRCLNIARERQSLWKLLKTSCKLVYNNNRCSNFESTSSYYYFH